LKAFKLGVEYLTVFVISILGKAQHSNSSFDICLEYFSACQSCQPIPEKRVQNYQEWNIEFRHLTHLISCCMWQLPISRYYQV